MYHIFCISHIIQYVIYHILYSFLKCPCEDRVPRFTLLSFSFALPKSVLRPACSRSPRRSRGNALETDAHRASATGRYLLQRTRRVSPDRLQQHLPRHMWAKTRGLTHPPVLIATLPETQSTPRRVGATGRVWVGKEVECQFGSGNAVSQNVTGIQMDMFKNDACSPKPAKL